MVQIGLFKILSESSVSAGVRRIEAVTGMTAYQRTVAQDALLGSICKRVKVQAECDIMDKICCMEDQTKELQKHIDEMKLEQMKMLLQMPKMPVEVKGIQVAVQQVAAENMEDLRNNADLFRNKLDEGVVLLAAVNGDQVQLVCMLTQGDVRKHLHAAT